MSCLLGDGWTWLKYCSFGCLTPTIVVSYCRGRPCLVLVNRLEGLSLPRNSTTINWPAWHDLVVDWAIKPQRKQNIAILNCYKCLFSSFAHLNILELESFLDKMNRKTARLNTVSDAIRSNYSQNNMYSFVFLFKRYVLFIQSHPLDNVIINFLGNCLLPNLIQQALLNCFRHFIMRDNIYKPRQLSQAILDVCWWYIRWKFYTLTRLSSLYFKFSHISLQLS